MQLDYIRTLALIKGGLLDHEATWKNYLDENPGWQQTAVLLTGPLLLANVLLSLIFSRIMGGYAYYGYASNFFVALLLGLLMAVLGFFVAVFVFNFLAGIFKGKSDFSRAFAAVSLAAIPAWLAGVVAALALRELAGPDRIARHGGAFDGVATLVLVLFVIPLFDRFWEVVLAMPWFALGTFAVVLAANWGGQALVAIAGRRVVEPGLAGSAGLMWGTRNVSIYFAALPPDPLFGLYVALYQLPMLFTPLVLGRVLRGRK